MELLSADEIQAELKRYYSGDPKARPPQHLYRLVRSEDVAAILGPDNWAVVRQTHQR
jgi:hypothetical protein